MRVSALADAPIITSATVKVARMDRRELAFIGTSQNGKGREPLAEDYLGIGIEPVAQNRRVDSAEVDRGFETARVVEIRQRGRRAVETSPDTVAQQESPSR